MPKWWSNDGSGRRFRFIELDALLWGDWYDTQGVHRKPGPERLGVVEKLNRRRYLSADELSYLKKKTSRIPKSDHSEPDTMSQFLVAGIFAERVSDSRCVSRRHRRHRARGSYRARAARRWNS
jgi:hypothetical protein